MVVGGVLQGGRSSRMGRDKAAIVVDGIALRDRARSCLAGVCDDVVLVGGDGADIVDDGHGPLVAVAALLRHPRAASASRVVVVAVDQPLLTPAVVTALVDACHDDDVVSYLDEPLPLVIGACAHAAVLAHIERCASDGMPARLRDIVTRVVAADDDARAALDDVDTPDDLRRLTGRVRRD